MARKKAVRKKTPFGVKKTKKVRSPTGKPSKPRGDFSVEGTGPGKKRSPFSAPPKKKKPLKELSTSEAARAIRDRKNVVEEATNTRRKKRRNGR